MCARVSAGGVAGGAALRNRLGSGCTWWRCQGDTWTRGLGCKGAGVGTHSVLYQRLATALGEATLPTRRGAEGHPLSQGEWGKGAYKGKELGEGSVFRMSHRKWLWVRVCRWESLWLQVQKRGLQGGAVAWAHTHGLGCLCYLVDSDSVKLSLYIELH